MPKTLDATGYNCPIPVLKTRKALQGMTIGEEISVTATDPASWIDIPHFCNTTGNELLDASQENGIFTYIICKAS